MTWPSPPSVSSLPSSELDSGLDTPANARDQIKQVRDRTQDVSDKLAEVINNGEPMLKGRVLSNTTAIPAVNLDCATGNGFSKTITAITTFTVSNVPPAGTLYPLMLELTNGGAFAVTWWAGVKWPGGSPPTLTASGKDELGFWTRDGGTTWSGVLVSKDSR